MTHAQYQEVDFPPYPMAERVSNMSFLAAGSGHRKDFTVGVKTITHNDAGIRLKPHKTVVCEIRQGDEVATFDIPPALARTLGQRLLEYAALLNAEAAVQ